MASHVHFPPPSTSSYSYSLPTHGKPMMADVSPPVAPLDDSASKAAVLESYGAHIRSSMEKGLWHHLYTSMHDIHVEALRNEFLISLINGKMGCSKAYVVYLCNLFWLHQALETAQERILKEGACCFVFPLLYRTEKLRADIQLWSIFNPTAKYFADIDSHSDAFLAKMRRFVQPCTFAFVAALESLADPLIAIGSMYALYGTIMSGGQLVKEGLKKAFLTRFQEVLEDGDSEGTALCATVVADPTKREEFAQASVSLFSFPDDVDIRAFKITWHTALDSLPATLPVDHITKQCLATVRIVLEMIDSLHKALLRGEI